MKRVIAFIFLCLVLAASAREVFATTDVAFTTTRLNKFGSVIIKVGQKFGFDISGLVHPIFNDEDQLAAPDHEPEAKWSDAFLEYFTPQQHKDDGKHIAWDANANPVFYTGYYGAILKTDAEHSNHPEPTDCYISTTYEKSSDVPWAPLSFMNARRSAAWLGIDPVDPVDGVVNFNLPSLVIAGMNPNEDCKKHEPGEEQLPVENDAVKLAQFGAGTQVEGHETVSIFETIRKWVVDHWEEETDYAEEQHKDDVILTIKKKLPWYHIQCLWGGCPSNEAGEFSGTSDINGGQASFTLREEDKKPIVAASEQAYKILVGIFPQKPLEASYDIKNQVNTRLKQEACYMVPDTSNRKDKRNLQNDVAIGDPNGGPIAAAVAGAAAAVQGIIPIGDMCSPEVPACGGEPPTFSGSSSCSQCSPNMSGLAESGTVPGNKLPDNLIKMVEEVGEAFGVPPASILTAMYHEGAFVSTQLDQGIYQAGPFTGGDAWTDENVIKWSTCGQTMPNCPLEGNTFAECNIDGPGGGQCGKAIVGTGVIPKWFWGSGGASDIWNAVQQIDSKRTQETISPCNLLDSVAALGKALSIWGQYPRIPDQCYGYSMTSSSPGSCSPSSWSDDKIVQSHVGMWVGSLEFCPDGSMPPPPEFGNNSTDPGYATNKVLNPYKVFRCQ